MEVLSRTLADAGRYPTNSRTTAADLRGAIARRVSVAPGNVALGAGSWEILRTAVRLYTSSARHLVTAAPSYEGPERMAAQLGVGVQRVPVDRDGRLDLARMAEAARWAGLVFVCNPNNPTGTVHSAAAIAEFVARVARESPDTAVLIDEAYHDYVTDPGYATAVPLALLRPNVIVSRTLSKAYGMAGMRVGYAIAQPRTIESFNRWAMKYNTNTLAVAAAIASLDDAAHIEAERARNASARAFTSGVFGQPRLPRDGFADQLRLRGDGLPGRRVQGSLREARRPGRPRVPSRWRRSMRASRSARSKRCSRRASSSAR
jgi:histidinol-phosphate aminotransferase